MSVLAIRAARLIDGLGNDAVHDMAIIIVDGKISEVVAARRIPTTATTLDFPDGTVLPGLVDAHTHLVWAGDAVPHEWVARNSPERIVLRMANAALANLRAGITTVRDLGATHGLSLPLAAAIAAGDIPGPRVIPAGRAIAMTGGHAWQITHEADGADAVRAAVRGEIKAGARCIKIMASGGVYDERAGLDEAQLTVEEMTAATQEAHKAGVKVAAHAYTPGPINLALDAGVDSIEHGSFLDEPTAIRMRTLGVYLVPTMTASTLMIRNAEAIGTPKHMRDKGAAVRDAGRAATRLALRIGTPLAGGSDAGGAGIAHGTFATEVELLVECGASFVEALRICTSQSAELCGVGDVTGSIAPGLAADLFVVDGDPRTMPTLLHSPRLALLAGQPVIGEPLS